MSFGTKQLMATAAVAAAAVAAAAAFKRNKAEPVTVRQHDLRELTERRRPPHAIVEEDTRQAEEGGPVHRLATKANDAIERTWIVHPHKQQRERDGDGGDSGGDAGYGPDGRNGEESIRQYEWWPR